jgi:hypothetical protein
MEGGARVVPVAPDGQGADDKARPPDSADMNLQEYEFEWQESVWHSGMLLFLNFGNLDNKWDTMINFLALMLNTGLQILFLLIIQHDMISDPFTPATLDSMMTWRMESHDVNLMSGSDTLVKRICDKKAWSFEQNAYNEIHDYLEQALPGTLLTTCSVLLWIFKLFAEYRNTLNQFIAVWYLPTVNRNQISTSLSSDEEGTVTSIAVVGIRNLERVCLIMCLCLPRLVIMSWLGYVGIRFLAQTVSLSDIVLNAMALSFVVDIDEQIYEVILSDSIHAKMKVLEPICVGRRRKVSCIPTVDLSRYAFMIASFVFGVILIFAHEVEISAAHEILCVGNWVLRSSRTTPIR